MARFLLCSAAAFTSAAVLAALSSPNSPLPAGQGLGDPTSMTLSATNGSAQLRKMLGPSVSTAVNDPYAHEGYQIYLDTIRVAGAWEIMKEHDPKDVLLALVDSGVQVDHEDLENVLWDGPGGIHGWNVGTMSPDVTDVIGHGTRMAGIVAAESNNAKGIAGVNPHARVMVLKMDEKSGKPDYFDVGRCLEMAAREGAKVVLLTFGEPAQTEETINLQSVMDRLYETYGMFFVMAAGDDATSTPRYPCAYQDDNTLCVTASGMVIPQLLPTSNFGETVDVAAPGKNVCSTEMSEFDTDKYSCTGQGSSDAAAMVAGLASMLVSVGVSPDRIRPIITETTDPPLARKRPISFGIVNATRALERAKQELRVQG